MIKAIKKLAMDKIMINTQFDYLYYVTWQVTDE